MDTIQRTADFDQWLGALRDRKAQARILARIASAQHGNFGDCKSVGGV
jgi:putative addiction module killer protein